MDRQITFADIEDASRKRATKREAFLDAMDAACSLGARSPRGASGR